MKGPYEITMSFEDVELSGGTRAVVFAAAVRTAQRLGHHVSTREWRDGNDGVYGIIARIQPETER